MRLQEQLGLAVVTDGEFRRLNFQDSFGESVSGYDAARASVRVYEHRVKGSNPLQRWENPSSSESKGTAVSLRHPAVERLRLTKNTPLEEFRFLSQVAQRPAKVTLIGPDRISQRFDLQKSKPVYADIDEFVTDVVKIEREMIRGLIEAGCRYIQIDAPGYTEYVDPPSVQRMCERGEDPKQNFTRSLKADNELLFGFDEITFGIHLCRGNQRSMCIARELTMPSRNGC